MNPSIFDHLITVAAGAVHHLLLLAGGGRIVPLPFMDYLAFYLDKPNMDWLISPADPYYGLLRQMAHIDNDVLPHADIIIFFRASFDNWEKLIMTRKRKSDIETIFPNAFYFQDILMEAVSKECVKSGSQLVIFESEFSSVEESASKLDNLLSNHIY